MGTVQNVNTSGMGHFAMYHAPIPNITIPENVSLVIRIALAVVRDRLIISDLEVVRRAKKQLLTVNSPW